MQSTEGSEVPEVYRRWAAITGIGAVLRQDVFMENAQGKLYPNLYVFLVGLPGVGKTTAIKALTPYLQGKVNFASTSVTGASLADEMELAEINYVTQALGGHQIKYYSLALFVDDLQVVMHEYSRDFVAKMTTFYDVFHYSERRRHNMRKEPMFLDFPQLSTLAGTTPSHLLNTLPTNAWDEGLMSRTIIIYSPPVAKTKDLFGPKEGYIDEGLMEDMDRIFNLSGQFSYSDRYRLAFKAWRGGECKPYPAHPRLRGYNARREAHLLKLSMVSCIDRGNNLHLERDDFDRAHDWLTSAEVQMPNVFSNVTSDTSKAIDEAFYEINGHTITEGKLGRFLVDRKVNTNSIKYTIDLMISEGKLEVVGQDSTTNLRLFKVRKVG